MRPIVRTLGLVGGILFLADASHAATIEVPGDYPTIYQALDAAQSGDIVEVAPGTYDQFDTRPVWDGDNVSAVGFLKGGVVLRSSGGAANTILRLDATVGAPTVLFGIDPDCEVEGFTLTGSVENMIAIAFPPSKPPAGSLRISSCVFRDFGQGFTESFESAIDCRESDLEILDCVFEDINSPKSLVVSHYASLAQVDCLVEDCTFRNCSGGGIALTGDIELRRSHFLNLGNLVSGFGAASCGSGLLVIVEECTFIGNQCSQSNFVPALAAFGSNAIVRKSTFAQNDASGSQDPDAYVSGDIGVEVTGNTFYGGPDGGGALRFFSYGASVLTNNVFSNTSGMPAVQRINIPAPEVQSGCNVFWLNISGNTEGFSMGPTDLVSDPLYCDAPNFDFAVNGASPCLPPNSNGCGQIGAWGLGCGPVSVEPSSWGQIKALYR
jgi:hypothetical protein